MTLHNKNWLKNEVIRAFLSADTQENIANSLRISVGTVNSIVNEFIKSDDTVEKQRQIAIVAKKNGVNIDQISANLRWKNKIKQSSLDDGKMEKFLDAMDKLFNKYDIAPSTASNHLFSLIEFMQRENIAPNRLEEEIKLKTTELQRLNAQIEGIQKSLDESKANFEREKISLGIKQKTLEQFEQISDLLKLYDLPELSTEYGDVVRAMIDFKRMGYDPKEIVSKYERIGDLTKAIEKLESKIQKHEKISESYRQRQMEFEIKWKDNYKAFELINNLVKAGLREEDIFNVINIIHKDFPRNSISKIMEDVRTYGSLEAAVLKLEREYNAKSEIIT